MPWGTHFCQFYTDKQELLEAVVPYLRAGLLNNERCFWVTSGAPETKEAENALRQAVPDLDDYLETSRLEIVPDTTWYLRGGVFDPQRILDDLIGKLEQALAQGCAGLRVTGEAWLKPGNWKGFLDYEERAGYCIRDYAMLALCSYRLDRCSAGELLEVFGAHQSALINRDGRLVVVESAERRRMVAELQQNNRRLSVLISNLPGMAYRCLNDRNRSLEFVSDGCAQLTGYSAAALTGRKMGLAALIHADDREKVWEETQKAVPEMRPFQTVYRIHTAGGEERWVWDKGQALAAVDGGSVLLEGFVTDINERKWADDEARRLNRELEHRVAQRTAELEAALKELRAEMRVRKEAERAYQKSEAQMALITNSLPVLIAYIDSEQRFRFNNQAYQNWFGLDSAGLHGKHVKDVLGEPTYEKVVRRYIEEALSGRRVSYERESPFKDGRRRYLQATYVPDRGENGVVRGLVALVSDITERKDMEQRIADALRLNQKVIAASSLGIAVYQSTGECILANEAKVRILGATGMDEVPKSNFRNNPKWNETDLLEAALEALDSGTEQRRLVQTLTNHGKEAWLDYRLIPFTSGGERHLLVVVDDDTERRSMETSLQEANAKLEVSNRELEAFSYSVSHDLRAPLRSIDGFSQALLEDCADQLDDQCRDYLHRSRAASQRMAALIDDLLELSHLTRAKMLWAEVNLSALACLIATDLQHTQPERQVDWVIQPDVVVRGDPRLLRVLIQNLLHNAWRFSRYRPRARIEFGVIRQKGKTVYFVRDDGAGFNMAYADKLFKPFQRLHSRSDFPGSGIGLATVQRVIDRHGGRIWAEGEEGKGATFYFVLSPRVQHQ